MTKSEFVKFVNDFGRVYSDFDPGLTEDAVSRFDERVVFTLPMRSFSGTATLDLGREEVEATARKLLAILIDGRESLLSAFAKPPAP